MKRFQTIAQLAGGTVAVLGGLALLGWTFNNPALKALLPGAVSMKAITAVCFMLLGLSLVLQARCLPKSPRPCRLLARALAALVVGLALLTLAEFAVGRDLGLDQLLFRESADQAGASFPGRMAMSSAINFCLLGLALLFLDVKTRRGQWPAQAGTLAAEGITLIALIGYLYGLETLYGLIPYFNMALNSVLAFLLLGAGILLARPAEGIVAGVRSSDLGGLMARRMVLPAILVPLGCGWLHVLGERAKLYGSGFGAALFTTAVITVFTALVWWSARTLSRVDAERKRVAEAAHRAKMEWERTFDSVPDLIALIDGQHRIKRVNRAMAERLGRTPEQCVGLTCYEHMHGTSCAPACCPHARTLSDAQPHTQEVHEERLGGDFLISTTPLHDEQGRMLGSVHVARDITERKHVELQLAYERDLFRTLLDHFPDAIYFKDRQSRFVHYSKSFMQLFHLSDLEALKGKTDFDFFTEEHARPAFEDEQEIMRTGQPMIGKLEKETHPDGRITWALTSKMPWCDKSGAILGTFGISKDVTLIKEAEARVAEAHKQLVTASRQAGMAEVATSVLHNVGNVLNSVNVSASVVADHLKRSRIDNLARAASLLREHAADLGEFLTGDPKGRQLPAYLDKLAELLADEQRLVLEELGSLTRNIEHIREIVAMQQNYATVVGVAEMVKVSDLVEDALRLNLGALARHGVEVAREYASQVPELNLDKHKALQILVNLIANAKAACAESGRTDKRLVVRVAQGNGHVGISVRDNGVGIPPENLTRIFNHGFTTRKGGHGFGLHSGALAARELGGALRAFSDGPGQGATFTLELPLPVL